MTEARAVESNQTDIYKDLEKVVRKYFRTTFLRPVADHTLKAFEEAENFIEEFYGKDSTSPGVKEEKPWTIILDSGCGTGDSTVNLAKKFPEFPVIGIDKSAVRLNKAEAREVNLPRNVFWVRAELLDFWRLAQTAIQEGRWQVPYHALYYPNPWPKQSEATRRFHLHPIFPVLMSLGKITELRTNWEIYAREFEAAVKLYADEYRSVSHVELSKFSPDHPETAFERKYKEARQDLWRVQVSKS